MKLYVKLIFLVGGGWVGHKKMKLMLYLTLVEIEVDVGVELGKNPCEVQEDPPVCTQIVAQSTQEVPHQRW